MHLPFEVFVWPLVILAVLISIWKVPETYRARRLATLNPGALVLTSGTNPALAKALSGLPEPRTEIHRGRGNVLPASFSVVADQHQLGMFRGPGLEFFSLDWAAVTSISVAEVADVTRSAHGVVIQARVKTQSIELPFIIGGRGPFGALPKTADQLATIVEGLETFRRGAATASPAA